MKKSLLIASFLAILASSPAQADCYSDGVRVGVVQKFSAKGFINKSWEGEMVQEGFRTKSTENGSNITNIWKFSVTDPAVAKKVEDAMFKGGTITVKYCQVFMRNPLKSNTSYEVTDVAVK